jgi:hypothetical protein
LEGLGKRKKIGTSRKSTWRNGRSPCMGIGLKKFLRFFQFLTIEKLKINITR